MKDSEIAQFPESKLESILKDILAAAKFKIAAKTRAKCLEIAQKYNKQTGALAVNALSVMGYAAEKGKKTFEDMVEKLNGYDFPPPKSGEVSEDYKYMHPEMRATIMRKSQGLLKKDMDFFQSLYDRLGVKPQE